MDIKQGYQNIDIFDHPDVLKMDIRNLKYKNEEVDEIFAKDVIEHFSYQDSLNCLREWVRVLKIGGKIFIQTIDLDLIFEAYKNNLWSIEVVNHMLFAGVSWRDQPPSEYDFHKCSFTTKKLIEILELNKIKIIEVKKDSLEDLKTNPYLHNLNMYITGIKI